MKKIAVLSSFLLFLTVGFAQPRISNIASVVDEEAVENGFNGIVLVADHGIKMLEKPVGEANHESGASIHPGSKFRIASMTKMFTAIVVMQLIEEGKLTLDQTIGSVLPSVPVQNKHDITIADCLLHTSGIPIEDDEAYIKARTPMEVVGMYANRSKGWGKLGEFRYSNLDYIVLGLVIEAVTQEPWYLNIQNRILDPCRMGETGFLSFGNYPGDLVTGYITDPKGDLIPEPEYHIENFFSAGCMYSTARDLLKLDQALYTEKLMKKETRELMYSPFSSLGYVSYGTWVYPYPYLPYNPKLVERRGGILGFQCVFVRFIEDNYTLIILSNNDRFNPDSYGDKEALKEKIIMQMPRE